MPKYVLQFEWNERPPEPVLSHRLPEATVRQKIERATGQTLDDTLGRQSRETGFENVSGIGCDSLDELLRLLSVADCLMDAVIVTPLEWDQPSTGTRICVKHQKPIPGQICADCLIESLQNSRNEIKAMPTGVQVTGPDWALAYAALASHVSEAYAHLVTATEPKGTGWSLGKACEAVTECMRDIRSMTQPMFVFKTDEKKRQCSKCGHSYVWVHVPGSSDAHCPKCGNAIVNEAMSTATLRECRSCKGSGHVTSPGLDPSITQTCPECHGVGTVAS